MMQTPHNSIWKRLGVLSLLLLLSMGFTTACGTDEDGSGGDIANVENLKYIISPQSHVFDATPIGETISVDFQIENTSPGSTVDVPINVTDVSIDGNSTGDFDVVCGKTAPFGLNIASPVSCTLSFTPTIQEGQSGRVVITAPNVRGLENNAVFTFTSLALEQDIEPDPTRLSLNAREGEEDTQIITIKNVGTFPLEVYDFEITGQPDIFKAEADASVYGTISEGSPLILNSHDDSITSENAAFKNNELRIAVTYAPETTGSDSAQLIVRSNDPAEPVLTIDLAGDSNAPCILVLDGTRVDFGNSQIGQINERTITVQNCGNDTLQINELRPGASTAIFGDTTSDAPFRIDTGDDRPIGDDGVLETPVSIEPGETDSFIVGYAPTEEQPNNGTIDIVSNDSANAAVELELFGRGVFNSCPVSEAEATLRGESLPPASQVQAAPLQFLIMDASDSYDENGSVVNWEWEIVERPEGSVAVIENVSNEAADPSRKQLFLDLAGRFVIHVFAIDDQGCRSEEPAVLTVLVVPNEAIHIQLVWNNPEDSDQTDTSGSDVDLHFMKIDQGQWFRSPYDNYFGNREPFWSSENPSLDIDDTNGAGPENINLDDPLPCQWYAVAVDYYRAQHGTAYTTLRIFINGLRVFEYLNKPLVNSKEWWDVARIHWPSGEVIMVDTVDPQTPSGQSAPITQGMIDSGLCGVPGVED